ncbi:MAG: hypothetical protein AABZ44_03205 [Elusimicrobiota bacterium]
MSLKKLFTVFFTVSSIVAALARMEIEGQNASADPKQKGTIVAKKVLGQMIRPMHEQVIDLAVNTMSIGEEAGMFDKIAASTMTSEGAQPRAMSISGDPRLQPSPSSLLED